MLMRYQKGFLAALPGSHESMQGTKSLIQLSSQSMIAKLASLGTRAGPVGPQDESCILSLA